MKLTQTYFSNKPPRPTTPILFVTFCLILGMSIVYWENFHGLADSFTAIPDAVFKLHQYWRPLSSLFIHLDVDHFASNTLSFLLFSHLLAGYFGAGMYLAVFLGIGSFSQALTLLTYSGDTRLLGASGAIYAMAGFWLALYFLVDRRFSIPQRALRTLGVSLAGLFPTTFAPQVSYQAHAIGFGCGIVGGITYFTVRKKWLRSFEVWEPEPVEIEEELVN